MSALLRLDGVDKRFEAAGQTLHVLAGVDLEIASGETVAITGPSGSGKSTLLGIMAGLERPSSGKLFFDGQPLHEWDEDRLSAWRRESVGFIFQNFRLIQSLTAAENVALALEIAGQEPRQAARRAHALLEELAMADRAGHFPRQLSGGEQQRVAIARAYAHGPRLILADEPTGSLDRQTAAKVLDALLEANRRHGAALVVVTHDHAVSERMSRAISLERR